VECPWNRVRQLFRVHLGTHLEVVALVAVRVGPLVNQAFERAMILVERQDQIIYRLA